jgi:hypothetical protein
MSDTPQPHQPQHSSRRSPTVADNVTTFASARPDHLPSHGNFTGDDRAGTITPGPPPGIHRADRTKRWFDAWEVSQSWSLYSGLIMTIATMIPLIATPGTALADADVPAVTYPTLPVSASNPADFVPDGWKIEKTDTGDLNADGVNDVVLVLHDQDKTNIVRPRDRDISFDSNPRILLVAFGVKDGGYRRVIANHRLIPRLTNPYLEDPFNSTDGISIRDGMLEVELHSFYSMGSWEMSYSIFDFEWQYGNFHLNHYLYNSIMRNSGREVTRDLDYRHGTARYSEGNTASDDVTTVQNHLPEQDAPHLGDIEDGLAFVPYDSPPPSTELDHAEHPLPHR